MMQTYAEEKEPLSTHPGVKIIEDRHNRPDFKHHFEGLEKSYFISETGIIFVRYRLPEERTRQNEKPHVVLAIPGGRNSPRGDYFHYIKRTLEDPTLGVTDFVTAYFPFNKDVTSPNSMVIDPKDLADDIANLDSNLKLPKDRSLTILGFCISADELVHGLHNGLSDKCDIDNILMLSPVTLFEDGRNGARNRYMPFILDEKVRLDYLAVHLKRELRRTLFEVGRNERLKWVQELGNASLNRLSQLLEKDKVASMVSNFLVHMLSVSPAFSDTFNKFLGALPGVETPPNIKDIALTTEQTFAVLDTVNTTQPATISRKVPNIHVVWTKVDLIPDNLKLAFLKLITPFTEHIEYSVDALSGSHGGSGLQKNIDSYYAAIQKCVTRTPLVS